MYTTRAENVIPIQHRLITLSIYLHHTDRRYFYTITDDLDLSPDFFEYMSAMYPILREDPTLWCVSAWNDNGKEGLVMSDPGL